MVPFCKCAFGAILYALTPKNTQKYTHTHTNTYTEINIHTHKHTHRNTHTHKHFKGLQHTFLIS